MKKVYQKPEFQIIVQNQANAKFFVASGGPIPNPGQMMPPTGQTGPSTGANFGNNDGSSDDNDTFNF